MALTKASSHMQLGQNNLDCQNMVCAMSQVAVKKMTIYD
jgi:hypothetical protein